MHYSGSVGSTVPMHRLTTGSNSYLWCLFAFVHRVAQVSSGFSGFMLQPKDLQYG